MKRNKYLLGGIVIAILLIAVVAIVSVSNSNKENAPAGKQEETNTIVDNEKQEDKTDEEVVLQDSVDDKSENQETEKEEGEETTEPNDGENKEEPQKEEVKEEEKEEPKKEEVKEEPKKEEPKKEEPKKENKVEAIPGQHRDANNIVVVIDPGHQGRGDNTKEPNGPGSSTMKARVTSGTTGVSTRVDEYVLNLDVSLKLKAELENRGYTVHMTRSTHDVNISNMERAQYATSVGADIAVRVHGNSVDKSSVRGAETLCPSSDNKYVSHLAKASYSLSKYVVDEYCKATGFKNRGVHQNDTMTGINWSEVPVTIIELGFMSNPEEDRLMQDADMQNNMVQGIANGIDAYFGL